MKVQLFVSPYPIKMSQHLYINADQMGKWFVVEILDLTVRYYSSKDSIKFN